MTALLILILSFLAIPYDINVNTSGYEVNDIASDFNLKNVDGKMVSLKNFSDVKGFIISFTCNECPYAQLYEQRIIDLNNEYSDKGYPVIAINPNDPVQQPGDSFNEMVKRSKEKNYMFPYLVDETQSVARAYGATNTPHVYVVEKVNATMKVKYIGAIDNNPKAPQKATRHYVKEAVNALLEGNTISDTETKAIGCGIKWK